MRFQENVIPETPRVTPASITSYAVIRRGLLRKLPSVRFATIYSVATSTVVPSFKGVAVSQDQRIDVIDAPSLSSWNALKLIASTEKAIIENLSVFRIHTRVSRKSRDIRLD